MLIVIFILDLIPEFSSFYQSTAYSISLLFGIGLGIFIFEISKSIEDDNKVVPFIKFSSLLMSSFFLFGTYRWIRVPVDYSFYLELGIKLIFYTIIVIFIVYASANLFDYLKLAETFKRNKIIRKLIDFKFYIAVLFSLIISYLTFGRNIFSSVYPLPFHIDWLFISLITLVIGVSYYGYLKNNTSELTFPSLNESSVIYNNDFSRYIYLQKNFIQNSKKDGLVFYLLDSLINKTEFMNEKEALDLLTPLILYEQKGIHLNIFSSSKDEVKKERMRKRILEEVMRRIEERMDSKEIKIV